MKTAQFIDNMPHVKCFVCKKYFVRHNASTDACDMQEGACACGAGHDNDHFCCVSYEEGRELLKAASDEATKHMHTGTPSIRSGV